MDQDEYVMDDMDIRLDKLVQKTFGHLSRFARYPNHRIVFFTISGKHNYEQQYRGQTRVIVPGAVYPDTAIGAKIFEHALARQGARMLDMTVRPLSMGASIRNALETWNG
jgi:hypothetical protein